MRAAPVREWCKIWRLNGVSLLFAVTHAPFVGIVAERLLPTLAGETMDTVTQLGTISFAFALRLWLGRRYTARAAAIAPGARTDVR